MINLELLLSQQGELAKQYMEQKRKIKLEKNREEKRREKVKKLLNLSEN